MITKIDIDFVDGWNITTKTRFVIVTKTNIPIVSPLGTFRVSFKLYMHDRNDDVHYQFYPKNKSEITMVLRMLDEDVPYEDIKDFLEL